MTTLDLLFSTLARTGGAPGARPPGPAEIVAGGSLDSAWDFVVKGGPTMVVIGLCSLVAVTVIVERSIVLRRGAVIRRRFVEGLGAVAPDRTRAIDYCRADASPAANVLAAVFTHRGATRDEVEKAVEHAGSRELVRLRQRMRLLSALPQCSTMLGLLGTILGMIKTFQAIATSAGALGKTELLAKGIFEAWTCTAAGLLVAIPVLVCYHLLMGRIDARAAELDRLAGEWIDREFGLAPAPVAAPPAVPAQAPTPAAVEMKPALGAVATA